MTTQELMDYCLQKKGAYTDCPFGAEPVCARVEKRIFAEIYLTKPWVTLRCEPRLALAYRAQYPQAVRRGYHCPPVQQPHKNTVELCGDVPEDVLRAMIDESYEDAVRSLSRVARQSLLSED